jgi:hypothetical protein
MAMAELDMVMQSEPCDAVIAEMKMRQPWKPAEITSQRRYVRIST